MVIRSRFKDYYDFVANQYGGGDPKVVYARGNFAPVPPKLLVSVEVKNCPLLDPSEYHRYSSRTEQQLDCLYLIVTGKAYLLTRKASIDNKNSINTYKVRSPEEKQNIPAWRQPRFGVELGKEYEFLIEISRKIQAPVFVIEKVTWNYGSYRLNGEVIICEQCPILGSVGMPSLIDPYQMYQDISMFVGNQLKVPTDTQPPVQLSNKQKILKAGFDLVKSFRHR